MALPLAISWLQRAKKVASSLVALHHDKWRHGVLQLDAICPPACKAGLELFSRDAEKP